MEKFQEIEESIKQQLDEAANLSTEDYKIVLETILGECEERLAEVELDEVEPEIGDEE